MYSLVPTGSNCASSAYVHVSVAFHKGTVARPGVDVRAGERKAMLTMHGRRYTCTTKPFSLLVALLVVKRLDMPSLAHVGSAKRTDTHPRHHGTIFIIGSHVHYWSSQGWTSTATTKKQRTLHTSVSASFGPSQTASPTVCMRPVDSYLNHHGPIPNSASSPPHALHVYCLVYLPLRQGGEGKQPVAETSEKNCHWREIISNTGYSRHAALTWGSLNHSHSCSGKKLYIVEKTSTLTRYPEV